MSDEKNKYITAYGSSNEDSYGRGDVTDISTKYNMLTTNPLSDGNAPDMNSYSSDGSYNQDIFGWKCFNSPVSFRNGIYGECGAIVASDEFYIYQADSIIDNNDIDGKSGFVIFNYGDARISCGSAHLEDSGSNLDSEAVHIKSNKGGHEAAIHVASTKTGDLPEAVYYSTIVLKSDFTSFQLDSDNYCTITRVSNTNNIQFTGTRDWVIGQTGRPLKSVYVGTVNVAGDIIPKTNNGCSLGSLSNHFNNLYVKVVNADEVYTNTLNSDNTFISVAVDLIPKDGGNVYSLGSENNYFNNIYCNTYNGETFKSRIATNNDIIETVLSEGLSFSQYVGSAQNWYANIKYNNTTGPNAALVTSVKGIDCIVVNESYATFNTDIIAKKSIKFDSGITLYEDDSGFTIEPGSAGMYIQGDLYVQGKISGKLPTTDLDTTQRIPIGATVCLSGLSANLGVGSIVQGTYSLCGLTGVTDPQGHTTRSDEEYRLLTSTSSNVTYALAMRLV